MTDDLEQRSDDSLLAEVIEGRADAFTELFRRRRGDVYRFALHMTGSTAVAEDVTQDVFVVVMRDAARYDSRRSTVTAWLCGIARNCARQRLERDRRLESLGDEIGQHESEPSVAPDPVAEITRMERVAVLRRALLALPVRYREVVVLCDLQELSYVEAAAAVGCAIGTVRSRLHRARTLLAARVLALESSKSEKANEPSPVWDADPSAPVDQSLRRVQKRCLA